MAVSLPKGGEINLMKIPENRYHKPTTAGPCHPTNSISFLENKMISRVGFEKFEYIVDREFDHF